MILLILVLAVIVRLLLIDQSFWLDEASQAMTSLRPLTDIIFHNLEDFHPPLSYVLTHYWIQIGRSEVWLRLLPVTFGVGTVYLLYLLGKELFNQKVGLLAALFLAVAPYHIYYSQEFRMYSIAAFFAVWSMVCFRRIVFKEREGGKDINGIDGWIGYILAGKWFVISSVLLLYTHYLGGLLFLGQMGYLMFLKRDKVQLFFKYYFLIGVSFLPWLPFFYQQLQVGFKADSILPGWSSMLSLSYYKALPLLFTKFVIGRIDFDNVVIYLGVIVISFLVVGIGFFPLIKKIKDAKILFLLFWFLVPVLLTFVISFKVPMFQPFRLLFVLPAFFLLLSVGILDFKKFQQYILRGVVLLLLIFQSVFIAHSGFWREDWKGAVLAADQFVGEGGAVLFAWEEVFPPYQFYSEKDVGRGGLLPKVREDFVNGEIKGRVVYFSYLKQLTDPAGETEKLLQEYGFKEVEVKDFRGVGFVYFYVPRVGTLGYLGQ